MNQKRQHKKAVEEPTAIYGRGSGAKGGPLGPGETVARIREGLPMAEFDGLAELLDLNAEELAGHLALSRSTLARRRKAGRLDMLESDRLLRFARLYARTEEVLEGPEAAREWLQTPARALEFTRPLEFARTEAGAREVENLLGRIEHGVFS